MTVLTPHFAWAQRKDHVRITVDVPNVDKQGVIVELEDRGHVFFKGVGGASSDKHQYELSIDLLRGIKSDESKWSVGARNVVLILVKGESGPYWERLLQEGKNVHCTIDWDHWKDEDDEGDEDFDMSNLDFGNGGIEEDDDDEEYEEDGDGAGAEGGKQ
mmetsp:Transcript_8614/g.17461  ORF Transcript_8614/g.17461 Transcript_8614/m.17461 type:complete len:159 (-) Transcript_8614:147-623(-)|eukprot:CAMPEP_0184681640 /NCGR_PEP_ID=MMETSP0312-20130426/4626_1 /TAXON_ID=31354 /ORGANISM="Compsopogon coeruleus, Strain SAG 36.94" /LENGTH=158 /DNA_ID=CAMNT_0027132617 /DNA_START=144 /DNA_END=620 /DNA_ORIENTATION=+